MMIFRQLILVLGFTWAAMAQSPVETVSVIVSRSATLPADEMHFSIAVTTAADVPLERVLQALEGTGITADHLIQVTLRGEPLRPQPPTGPGPLTYGFLIAVPADGLQEMTGKLAEIQRAGPEGIGALTASARLSGRSDRVEDVRNVLLPELVAEARRRAGVFRQAAGLTGDSILFLAESSNLPSQAFTFDPTGGNAFPNLNLQGAFGLTMRVGQGGPRLLNIGATKSVSVPPDEVTVAVTVVARTGSTQQQILAALARAGVTASDIVSVNVQSQGQAGPVPPGVPPAISGNLTVYSLQMTRPAAQLPDVAARLAEVQSSPQILSLQYSAALTASGAAIAAAREMVMPELLEQARLRAETLASAAEVRLGSPVVLLDLPGGLPVSGFPLGFGIVLNPPAPAALRPSFAITVQYALE